METERLREGYIDRETTDREINGLMDRRIDEQNRQTASQ